MAQLARDRARALRALMPRAYNDRTTSPAGMYRALTASGRAEVDRVVEAFQQVRTEALHALLSGQPITDEEP